MRGTYWLDANVFIVAKDGPYRFRTHPGFWQFMAEQAKAGTVRSPWMVYEEIVRNSHSDDELAQWAKSRKDGGLFAHPDEAVQRAFTKVADHVDANYQQHQAGQFLSVADPWLIAHAMAAKGTVVTFEKLSPGAHKVKIPNVCGHFQIKYVDLYTMLETFGATFSIALASRQKSGR